MSARLSSRRLLPVALSLLLGVGLAKAGDIYRWTDADGRVHYGDQPPPQGAQKVDAPPPPPLSPQEAEQRLEEIRARNAASAEARAKAREERAKAEAQREQRAAECAAARRQRDAMLAAQRIRGADGQWYTGEQRLEKLRELEKAIAEHCGGNAAR